MRKTVSGIMLILLLIGVLMLPFRVQPVRVGSKTNIPDFDVNVDNTTTTQQTAQLILETDKHVYLLGENVTIILKNVGDRGVEIGGYPAWQIFTYPEEEPVYPAIFATLAWSLEPEQNDTFVWNQYNQFNETFCSSGTYVVKDTHGWGLSAYFEIISANIIVPDDYPSIRQAVLVANAGDTVYVRAGIYYEKEVDITKPVTIFGEHRNFTIIDGNGSWVCVYVKSTHHVRLSEFTIQNGYGVYLYNSHNVTISENIISNNGQGIILIGSRNNTICQNTVTFNNLSILLSDGSTHNIISKNQVTMNNGDGIWLDNSFENIVRENIVSKNGLGTAPGYHVYGIRLSYSNNNAIYHNLIMNNYEQADGWMSINNTWDNGYPSGGNYWSNYSGLDLYSGPHQNETGSDGIGDTPYVIDEYNQDNYPLMSPVTLLYYELLEKYNNLLTDYRNLNSTYRELLNAYDELMSQFENLNSTYYQLLGNFSKLVTDFNALNATYHAILLDYGNLNVSYTLLNSSHYSLHSDYEWLNSTYNDLRADYNSLNSTYNDLEATFSDYKESTEGELSYIRNLMYLFMATTTVFAAAAVYFAVRKPKRKLKTQPS